MKEKTASAAAAGDEVPEKPAPKPKAAVGARFRHLIGEMWPAYLIEIVVIILGISITLALEQWRDGAKEDKLEKVYRNNLAADLDVDLASLKRATDSTKALLEHGDDVVRFIQSPTGHPLTGPELTQDLRSLLAREKFIAHDATFTDLKSSGNLHLIKDVDLKWLLFAYYSQTQIIKENQEAEQQATITLVGPYFLKRFALDGLDIPTAAGRGDDPRSLAADIEFRNGILLRMSTRKELSDHYRRADSLATLLKTGLLNN